MSRTSALGQCLSFSNLLFRSLPLLAFYILFFIVPAPRPLTEGSAGAAGGALGTRLGFGGLRAGGSSSSSLGGTVSSSGPLVDRYRCPMGPYAPPPQHDPFTLPEEPLGYPLPPSNKSQRFVEWRDDATLFLNARAAAEARPGAPFFRNLHGRASTHLFDPDFTMTMLATYGHFLYVQRPQRATSPWHNGEVKDRRHTLPFITGDGFRALADFWCDNEVECRVLPSLMGNASLPVWGRLGSEQSVIVFSTCHDVHLLLDAALPLLDAGQRSIVLVVHNGDETLDKALEVYLEHPRLTALFTQNCGVGGEPPHRKVVCIPIGLEPRQFSMHGWRPETLMGSMLAALQGRSPLDNLRGGGAHPRAPATRRIGFAAWSVGTFREERGPLLAMLEEGGAHHALHVEDEPPPLPNPDKPAPSNYPPGPYAWVTIGGGGQLEHYHRHILRHSAVLAPRGNGLDTLRAWEALYLGRMVVTKNSTMDPVFDDLPVVILRDWGALSEALVRERVQWFSSQEGRATLAPGKLYMYYWACELGRAAGRAGEFCSTQALESTLLRDNWA
jgi:hypothetical protein